MAGKVAAGEVGDGHGDHQRNIPAVRLGGVHRSHDARLGIQGVENRLDQDEVDAARDQRVALLAIDALQTIEIDLAITGIVDVWRQRQRLVGWADGAGDETGLAVLRLEIVRGFRSEEHTSELQSLMRISYAVFCLKKKTQLICTT